MKCKLCKRTGFTRAELDTHLAQLCPPIVRRPPPPPPPAPPADEDDDSEEA